MPFDVNIWASNKDISIKHLLLMLADQFEEGSYQIVESSLDDERAIRLTNPLATGAQLYIFTYGQQEECFGVHIEYPNLVETNYSDTLQIHENISFDALVDLLVTHLELSTNLCSSR